MYLSDFADQAVILPMIVAIAVTLASSGWKRGAGAWLLASGGTLGLMLALKVVFFACNGWDPRATIHSPSGHTAAAAMISGGLIALMGGRAASRILLVMLAAIVAALLFGFTRVAIGAHTLQEAILGGFVGIGGAFVLAKLAGPAPEGIPPVRLAAVAVAVLVLFHGFHLNAEAHILHAASILDVWPFTVCRP